MFLALPLSGAQAKPGKRGLAGIYSLAGVGVEVGASRKLRVKICLVGSVDPKLVE